MQTKKIHISVETDNDNVPTSILWEADDAKGMDEAQCRAMILALWDHKNKDTLRLDLWTRTMTVDEMKIFVHRTLLTLADTVEKSIADDKIAGDMRDFCEYFADKMEIK
jgi:gliding motility-associated protein GldC